MSSKTFFATESLVQQRMPKKSLVKQFVWFHLPCFCSLFCSLLLHQVWFSKSKLTTFSSPKEKDQALVKKHGVLCNQTYFYVSSKVCTTKKNISAAFSTTEYSETVWRDTIYVNQNASINHAYNPTWALLSRALTKGTLPVSLSYKISTKAFLVK